MRYPFADLAAADRQMLPELIEAATRVITSGRYIGGPECEALEAELCRMHGAPYAVGVSNGLDALRLILKGYMQLGRLNPGDEVIVPANTYIATILAITDAGLIPVPVEPSPDTLNIDTELIEAAVTPRTRAIMTVHLYGRPAWDARMADIVRRHGLLLLEDNAQAIGARADIPGLFGTDMAGALGHAGAFSFYPTKNAGAIGDAGAVVTHDPELAAAVRALANYGSDRRYHNIYQGYNCRLDPIQAAIVGVRLRHLDDITVHRRAVAGIYREAFDGHPAIVMPADHPGHVHHQFVILSDRRDELQARLAAEGIGTDIHYATPPHRQPCMAGCASLHRHPLPVTDRIADTCLSLPVTAATSVDDARHIAGVVARLA